MRRLWALLAGLFAGTSVTANAETLEPPAAPENPALQRSFEVRDAYWKGVGNVDPNVMAHLISPGLLGGPAWPTTRQAYLIVRRGDIAILASDGLSDPFNEGDALGNGFQMELFIATRDLALGPQPNDADYMKVRDSWQFELLRQAAAEIADVGGITTLLFNHEVISTEFPGVSQSKAIKNLPPAYISADDAIGVLIGAPLPDFPTTLPDMPLSSVQMVPIILLTADELAKVRKEGGAARKEIVRRLIERGEGYVSGAARKSVYSK